MPWFKSRPVRPAILRIHPEPRTIDDGLYVPAEPVLSMYKEFKRRWRDVSVDQQGDANQGNLWIYTDTKTGVVMYHRIGGNSMVQGLKNTEARWLHDACLEYVRALRKRAHRTNAARDRARLIREYMK